MSISYEQTTKPVRKSASTVVRADYKDQLILSYAEAALIAGVSVGTIQNWVSKSLSE